jgi:hypothetical protein
MGGFVVSRVVATAIEKSGRERISSELNTRRRDAELELAELVQSVEVAWMERFAATYGFSMMRATEQSDFGRQGWSGFDLKDIPEKRQAELVQKIIDLFKEVEERLNTLPETFQPPTSLDAIRESGITIDSCLSEIIYNYLAKLIFDQRRS